MKLAFVVCSGRSGSTLLASMLNMHPDIHVPVELIGLYSLLPRRLGSYGDLRRRGNRELLGQDLQGIGQLNEFSVPFDQRRFVDLLGETDRTARAAIRCFYETLLPEGKTVLVDKTPNHSPHHRRMHAFFPEARFVHLVRDGRDVALSALRAKKGVYNRNVQELGTIWSRTNLELAKFGAALPGQYLRVRYEDLVTDPRRELSAICEFLSEPFVESLLEFSTGDFAQANVRTLSHHANLRRDVMRDNVGKWRNGMDLGDREIFETLAGPALREFGYECPARRWSPRTFLRTLPPWAGTQLRRVARFLRRARVEATFRAAVLVKRLRSRG